ncbi:MAG: hypothetical protein QXN55_01655 [Candidatus Nitrosotenuis sp.]
MKNLLQEIDNAVTSQENPAKITTFAPVDDPKLVQQHLDNAVNIDDGVDTITFGLETDDGEIVKVYVDASQADEFEKRMSELLGQEDDIEKAIDTMATNFDIVHVEWPEGQSHPQPDDETETHPTDFEDDSLVDEPQSLDISIDPNEIEDDDKEEKDKKDDKDDDDNLKLDSDDAGQDDFKFDDGDFGSDSDNLSLDNEKPEKDSENSDDLSLDDEEQDTDEEEDEDAPDDSEDEEEPEDDDPGAKKKAKKKQPKKTDKPEKKEKTMDHLEPKNLSVGQQFAQRILGEAKDVRPNFDKEQEEIINLATSKMQEKILTIILLLNFPPKILRLEKPDLKRNVRDIAVDLVGNARAKMWINRLIKELIGGNIKKDDKEEIKEAHSAFDDAYVTRTQEVLEQLFVKLGVPASFFNPKKAIVKTALRETSVMVISKNRVKTILFLLAESLGINVKVVTQPPKIDDKKDDKKKKDKVTEARANVDSKDPYIRLVLKIVDALGIPAEHLEWHQMNLISALKEKKRTLNISLVRVKANQLLDALGTTNEEREEIDSLFTLAEKESDFVGKRYLLKGKAKIKIVEHDKKAEMLSYVVEGLNKKHQITPETLKLIGQEIA